MANAIIGGLLASGCNAGDITVSDPYEPTRKSLEEKFKVATTEDNQKCIAHPDTVLILAVKPQVMKIVAEGIATRVAQFKPLVITIAAVFSSSDN